jgi:hypothetical protein
MIWTVGMDDMEKGQHINAKYSPRSLLERAVVCMYFNWSIKEAVADGSN